MTPLVPVLVGALAAAVFGTAVSAAVVRSGDDTASVGVTTTVAVVTTTMAPAASTTTTAVAGPTTTRTAAPRSTTTAAPRAATTTTAPPPTTVPPTTSTTRPPLTRAAATESLCKEIEASVRLVVGGNTTGGGLRLIKAVSAYGDIADPTVVVPARRMLSAALSGDLEGSAVAAREAESACNRLGIPIRLPYQPQCIVEPCPPLP